MKSNNLIIFIIIHPHSTMKHKQAPYQGAHEARIATRRTNYASYLTRQGVQTCIATRHQQEKACLIYLIFILALWDHLVIVMRVLVGYGDNNLMEFDEDEWLFY